MRRLIEFANRAVQRVNARLAMLVVAGATGGVAVWQGVSHWPTASAPKGPTKQVATGVRPGDDAAPAVRPATASLSDDQLPAGGDGNHRLLQYGQTAAPLSSPPPPQTNPYLHASNDPPGGYAASLTSGSRYDTGNSTYGQYAAAVPAAAVPTDPTAAQPPTEPVPENIYRPSVPAATPSEPVAPSDYAPLGQSPYAAAPGSTPPAAPPAAEASDLNPTATAGQAFGNRGGGATAYTQPAPLVSIDATPPADQANSLPPNPLSAADLNASPYAAAAQPLRSLATSGAGNSGRASQSYSGSPLPGPLPKAEGAGKFAAPTPGERHLEGPQQPSISLEKVSPSEIQIGKPATFELYVRNAGQVPASGVVVTDHVPAGTQLIEARPPPQQAADGSLVWSLGAMQPGDETQITLQVMPQTEGEIGSTAHVSFAASATSRSICTRPQLAIEQTAPPKVLIGEALTVGITISNPGTGPATGVIIEEDVPAGLAHVAGSQLEYEIGTLRPGESKHLDLSLRADKPGIVQNVIQVRGDANLAHRHAVQIEVVAPQLQVAVEGPKVRFLQRQATYTVQIANPGTAAARDVELIAHLPRGMKFVLADSQGQYDVSQHAVYWSLAELPPATRGAVKLSTLPVEPGDQPLRVEGRGALGVSATGEQIVRVEQAAELVHTVKDLDEVIEVGSETTYEVRVVNTGTKAATNVRVAALMSSGMAALHGEGPTRAAGDATQIVFEPLARLNPQEEVIYRVQAQGRQPGDQIVRVQVASDEWPAPVTREESTRVYQDR